MGGGLWFFSPVCKFFFVPNEKQTFFSSRAKQQANFSSLYNPICLPVLWTNFYFLQFAEQTIFHHLMVSNLFFSSKKPHSTPPPISFGRPLIVFIVTMLPTIPLNSLRQCGIMNHSLTGEKRHWFGFNFCTFPLGQYVFTCGFYRDYVRLSPTTRHADPL